MDGLETRFGIQGFGIQGFGIQTCLPVGAAELDGWFPPGQAHRQRWRSSLRLQLLSKVINAELPDSSKGLEDLVPAPDQVGILVFIGPRLS